MDYDRVEQEYKGNWIKEASRLQEIASSFDVMHLQYVIYHNVDKNILHLKTCRATKVKARKLFEELIKKNKGSLRVGTTKKKYQALTGVSLY